MASVNIFGITFQAVAVLLGIGVLGFWIIGRRHVPTNALVLLTSIAIDIALPCLVLANILTQFSPQEHPDWWQLPLWWIGFTLITVVLSLGTAYIVKRDVRPEFTMSLLYQNGIFFPLIIITGIFGSESIYLVQLFLFIFLHPSFVFSTYALFYGKKAGDQKLNWRRIVNPVMVVTLIGLVIGLASIKSYVPNFLVTILIMVGGMATPLFMLILEEMFIMTLFIAASKAEGYMYGK